MQGQDLVVFVIKPKREKQEEINMTDKTIPYKIYLDENEMPKYWYNVRADMKNNARIFGGGTQAQLHGFTAVQAYARAFYGFLDSGF